MPDVPEQTLQDSDGYFLAIGPVCRYRLESDLLRDIIWRSAERGTPYHVVFVSTEAP